MTRLQALKELARKVKAGEFDAAPGGAKYPMFNAFMDVAEIAFGMYEPVGLPRLSWEVYKGSLDAAKALHEALLPGWSPVIDICVPCVDMYCEIKDDASISTGEWEWMFQVSTDANPARSWLLAILKALIAQEEE